MFIAIEGIDGSGGTTQVKLLEHYLLATGKQVWTTREPSEGPVGKLIKEIQGGNQISNPDEYTMMYLYAADRAEHLKEINHHLGKGEVVISDRYKASSLAYQDFRDKYVRAWEANADFFDPDITIIIDVPVEEALKRIETRGTATEIFEKKYILEKVRERYQYIYEADEVDKIFLVDGKGTPEEVFDRISALLKRKKVL